MEKKIESTVHAVPQFLAGSFAVHSGDHLRSGIICGPSFLIGSLYTYRLLSRQLPGLDQICEMNARLGTFLRPLCSEIPSEYHREKQL